MNNCNKQISNMKTKGIITTLLVAATTMTMTAQDHPQLDRVLAQDRIYNTPLAIDSTEFYKAHRLSIYGVLGYGGLMYNDGTTHSTGKFSGAAGVDYKYFWNENWGVSIGLSYAHYGSDFKSSYTKAFDLIDSNKKSYLLHQKLDAVESQSVGFLSIPVKIQYRTLLNNPKWEFNAAAGLLGGMRLYENKSIAGTITRKAYFPQDNVLVDGGGTSASDLAIKQLQGIGSFKDTYVNPTTTRHFDYDVSILAEVGVSYKFNELLSLDLGAYATYGVKNVKNEPAALETSYAEYLENSYSGVSCSNLIDGIHPYLVGVKVGLSFDMGAKCPTAKTKKATSDYNAMRARRRAHINDSLLYNDRADDMLDEYRKILQDELGKLELNAPKETITKLVDGRFMYIIWDFVVGSSKLGDKQIAQLKAFNKLKDLSKATSSQVQLIGRADETGTSAINTPLSLDRAEAVKAWLNKNSNIDPSILSLEGRSADDPISSSRDLNRSVVIIF